MIYRPNVLLLLISTITIKHVLSQASSFTCTIPHGIINHTYNFTQLSNTDVMLPSGTVKETMRLRLCSPLATKCGGRDGYSICLNKNGKEIGIGKSPPELKIENNGLVFNFTGDSCKSDKNYTVLIIMKCDYSINGSAGPDLFPHIAEDCTFHMIWKTKLACTDPSTTNCSIVDEHNNRFDLSPLTMTSENHVVWLDERGAAKMIINVCHSIIHETGAACSRPAGACLANSSDVSDPYRNYGEMEKHSLFIEDNTLKIKYTNGDMCAHSETSLNNYETTISFICDPKAIANSEPKFSNKSRPCSYEFTWKTAVACADTVKCRVNSPEFNFQKLMNQDFTANNSHSRYKFRICGPLIDKACPEGTGVCDIKNSVSAGSAHINLLWQHGGPYLNYTDGAECGNGLKRYTLIAFVCGPEGSANLPIIVKDEPCSLIIHWYTDLACNKTRIACAQNQTNLIPLIRNSENYVVNAAGTEFHINICRPVVPTPGLACPHGSAACRAVRNSKGQYTKEISLGFPDQNPVLDGNQNLILNYTNGSPCPENPQKNISSSFKFFCDFNGDVGLPEYKSYSDCHYIFEWRTNIVCGAVVGEWSAPCVIKDSSHSHELNLSALYKEPVPRFVTSKGKNYSINICGGEEHCNGSAVCQGKNGYGTFSHVTFDYRSKLIKLQYSNGTNCSKESYASELSLICNNTAGVGNPILILDANCSALFAWQTSIACPEGSREVQVTVDPLLTSEKTLIDSSQDYSSVQTWIVSATLILVILVIGMWLYLRNPQRCAHLRSRISAILATKNHSRVQYARVNTTEEARLLLDTSDPCTDGHIDSDDELLGV